MPLFRNFDTHPVSGYACFHGRIYIGLKVGSGYVFQKHAAPRLIQFPDPAVVKLVGLATLPAPPTQP